MFAAKMQHKNQHIQWKDQDLPGKAIECCIERLKLKNTKIEMKNI
jgi:hypothetical protein